jgi:aminoacylase
MAAFLDSETFRSLPGVALALDEGLASVSETLNVFYGERIPWFVQVTATGPTGHGSRFIDNTAVEQLLELCQKALQFRQGQRDLLGLKQDQNCSHAVAAAKRQRSSVQDLGEVTSLNITMLEAGVKSGGVYAYNCVPPSASCALDIRISPHTDPGEIDDMLNRWCRECSKDPGAGAGLSWEYLGRGHDGKVHHLTSTEPKVNPWYGVFCRSLEDMGLSVEPQVFPAASDSRFLRALGIRALGFSPMRSTPDVPCQIMLHEVDEYIPEATFLEGIGIYVNVIRDLASQGPEMP